MKAWAVIQAALEYGGATDKVGLATPEGVQNIMAWVDDHRLAVIGAVVLLLILGLSLSERRT